MKTCDQRPHANEHRLQPIRFCSNDLRAIATTSSTGTRHGIPECNGAGEYAHTHADREKGLAYRVFLVEIVLKQAKSIRREGIRSVFEVGPFDLDEF